MRRLLALAILLLSTAAFAAQQTVASHQGFVSGVLSGLVKPAITIIIVCLPAMLAIPMTILHVTFWRRDNRAAGGEAFNQLEIRDKVYFWGRIYGVGSVLLLQGLVEMLLGTPFSWYMRGSLVVVGFACTGFAARVAFDFIRGHAASKAEKGSRRWRRIYNYLTVKHKKAADGTDDTFFIDPDKTPTPNRDT